MLAWRPARISSRLVALQRPQDKVAEKEAEARGGAADVAINPSSYDFERRFDDQTIELRDQCHMLQTDKVGLQPACDHLRPACNRMHPACNRMRPAYNRMRPARSLTLLLATYLPGGADATGVPAPGPVTGGLAHRAHRARTLPQGQGRG